MINRKMEILQLLKSKERGMSASQMAAELNLDRTNASRYLNELYKENRVVRIEGRPVIYEVTPLELDAGKEHLAEVGFDNLIGAEESLKISIQQAKAAILYPPRGLHTIIFGETGTGKSLFAECMYHFAVESGILSQNAPFVSFNCADYAQNPQLLFGHIFGVKKGAYTGAIEDQDGLVAEADGGILFLDEIHRLSPEGQEMLFTFIDKGTYRPLGESVGQREATVQLIGATTENSSSFLQTFNRRIPMVITLPPLSSRTLDERYEMVARFISQEATRLNQRICVEKETFSAFMLYTAEGNIGQIKRDLKLVCAKAFLHYRTHNETCLTLRQKDLPLHVQKGLLRIKELPERINRSMDNKSNYLTFDPGTNELVWVQDSMQDMEVYNAIEEKVEALSSGELDHLDLETLIASKDEDYFQDYVAELSQNNVHRELISERIWQLTDNLYNLAEEKLQRSFNKKARFAFALHLQGMIERVRENHLIVHPDLNNVRKKYSKEFQVAIDLSGMIEEEFAIEIPFDEIGFITMFLTLNQKEVSKRAENKVTIVILMHGKSTASSLLEAVQELLGTNTGVAFNMPLTMEVQQMYDKLRQYVKVHLDEMSGGLLLLTDMGSLNSFGDMIFEETGIRTKAIAMVSTMVVLEAVRMASVGRSLEDIYQNVQLSFESVIKEQYRPAASIKKAVIVTCFTGEGVAKKLYERVAPVIDQSKMRIIQMQFLEKEAFKKHIDELLEEYDIKAIVGTVDVSYQNIPFFSAFDIFEESKLAIFKRIVGEEVSVEQMVRSLEGTIHSVDSVSRLIISLQKTVHEIQKDLHIMVEAGVDSGIILHLAFLIDSLRQGKEGRSFRNLAQFKQKNRMEMDIIRTHLMGLESLYQVKISDEEAAHLTQMFQENKINWNG